MVGGENGAGTRGVEEVADRIPKKKAPVPPLAEQGPKQSRYGYQRLGLG